MHVHNLVHRKPPKESKGHGNSVYHIVSCDPAVKAYCTDVTKCDICLNFRPVHVVKRTTSHAANMVVSYI